MTIHDVNQGYAANKGATMLRGYDGYDNYFLLGTFPTFGARLALRARCSSAGKKGTKIGFKLRLMPIEGAEHGNWAQAMPGIQWAGHTLGSDERRSACFGIGLAAWTRDAVMLSLKDVDYPQVLDNWLTQHGLTWDEKQRAMLPTYLADAANALFADDYGDGAAPIDVEGRVAHEARQIVPEDAIWFGEDLSTPQPTTGLFSGGDEDDEPAAEDGDD